MPCLQNKTLEEDADMPNVNYSETVHHSWKIGSGNMVTNLFEATVDDIV